MDAADPRDVECRLVSRDLFTSEQLVLRWCSPRPLAADMLSELASSSSDVVRECCFESERLRLAKDDDMGSSEISNDLAIEILLPVSFIPEDVGGRLK